MDTRTRRCAGVAVTLAVMTAAACSMSRVSPRDATQSTALTMAVDNAERARMAHVAIIVDTQRRLAKAEDLLDMEEVSELLAESDQEQLVYAQLVRAELSLRHELALAPARSRR
jgi:hypothetical protein